MPIEAADIALGYLTLGQVAEQLSFAFPAGKDPLPYVKRLIARGSLKAQQFGRESDGGATAMWGGTVAAIRVRLDDLKSFLANSGQRVDAVSQAIRQEYNLPTETMAPIFPLNDDQSWFTNPWAYETGKLIEAMKGQLNAQLDALVTAARLYASGGNPKLVSRPFDSLVLKLGAQLREGRADPISVEIPIAPQTKDQMFMPPQTQEQIRQLIATPANGNAPGGFLKMAGAKPDSSMFLSLTEILLASELQSAARGILRTEARADQMNITAENAGVLYGSPPDYQRIRDAATTVFLSGAVAAATRVAMPLGGPFEEIVVQLSFGNQALMEAAGSSGARLGSLAF